MAEQQNIFGVSPATVLTRAYIRRIQKPEPADGETVLIEKNLIDDLIKVAEQANKLHMADESLRRLRVTVEGGNNNFKCEGKYLNDSGECFVTAKGEGHSLLGALMAASADFNKKLDDWTR